MYEIQYLEILQEILKDGVQSDNRTGVKTKALFCRSIRHNLQEGFPLITTRKAFLRGAFEELMWFLRGETDSKLLEDKGVNFWKGNTSREFLNKTGLDTYPEGQAGPVYGFQLRNFNGDFNTSYLVSESGEQLDNAIIKGKNGFDQLEYVCDLLKNNPQSRRILFSYWNPLQLDKMALPPCHILYVFSTIGGKLNAHLTQRSCDFYHGVWANIASLGLLTHILAKFSGLEPGKIHWTGVDVHLYESHFEAAQEMLIREPFDLPTLSINTEINTLEDILSLEWENIVLEGYQHHDPIKVEMVA